MKYDDSFFKSPTQEYPQKAFVIPNLGNFVFSQDITIYQIWGCWFQMW